MDALDLKSKIEESHAASIIILFAWTYGLRRQVQSAAANLLEGLRGMLLCGSMLGPLRGKFSLPDRPRSARLDSVTQHASHLASKPSKFCSVCSTTRKSCPIRGRFYETPNCRALTVLIGNKSREQERGSIADSRQCQVANCPVIIHVDSRVPPRSRGPVLAVARFPLRHTPPK